MKVVQITGQPKNATKYLLLSLSLIGIRLAEAKNSKILDIHYKKFQFITAIVISLSIENKKC